MQLDGGMILVWKEVGTVAYISFAFHAIMVVELLQNRYKETFIITLCRNV